MERENDPFFLKGNHLPNLDFPGSMRVFGSVNQFDVWQKENIFWCPDFGRKLWGKGGRPATMRGLGHVDYLGEVTKKNGGQLFHTHFPETNIVTWLLKQRWLGNWKTIFSGRLLFRCSTSGVYVIFIISKHARWCAATVLASQLPSTSLDRPELWRVVDETEADLFDRLDSVRTCDNFHLKDQKSFEAINLCFVFKLVGWKHDGKILCYRCCPWLWWARGIEIYWHHRMGSYGYVDIICIHVDTPVEISAWIPTGKPCYCGTIDGARCYKPVCDVRPCVLQNAPCNFDLNFDKREQISLRYQRIL